MEARGQPQEDVYRKREKEVHGGGEKCNNETCYDLYTSPNVTGVSRARRMRSLGHVARIWHTRNAYRILEGKPEGKRQPRKRRRRWEDDIKMDFK